MPTFLPRVWHTTASDDPDAWLRATRYDLEGPVRALSTVLLATVYRRAMLSPPLGRRRV